MTTRAIGALALANAVGNRAAWAGVTQDGEDITKVCRIRVAAVKHPIDYDSIPAAATACVVDDVDINMGSSFPDRADAFEAVVWDGHGLPR